MSKIIVILTNKSIPDYMWFHITDKTPEEHAESLFTEAIPVEFTIERVIEADTADTGRKRNWDADYPIEQFYKDTIEQFSFEDLFEVSEGSGIIKVGGDLKWALDLI